MSAERLSVSRLCAGYGAHPAVADISFSLREREILCLVGESGCGKTTLLRTLLSAPETRWFSGEILLGATSLSGLSEKARRSLCSRKLGMVFQTPEAAFNPIRTYRRQLIETLKSHRIYRPEAFEQQVASAFAKVELEDWRRILGACPYALSGGMNQRVALALAMLLGQDILLCDEPTSALDATIQLSVAGELKKLRDDDGVAQIIVTHNLALAGFLADRIGVMYAGRLVEIGRAEDVLHRPSHPYSKSLIAAVPGLDGRLPTGLPGSPSLSGPQATGCEFRDRCPLANERCAGQSYALKQVGDDHFSACAARKEGKP